MTLGVRRKAAALAGAALLAVTALSGCSGDDTEVDGESPSPSTPDAGPTDPEGEPEPTVNPDEEAVLAAWLGYWEEHAAAVSEPGIDEYLQLLAASEDGDGESKSSELPIGQYAAGPAFSAVTGAVLNLDRLGDVMTGQPENLAPEVTALETEVATPAAEIRDCMNISQWVQHDRESGEEVSLSGDRLDQYVVTAQAEDWEGNGTWLIVEVEHLGEAC
ncbi:hypothetical protein ACFC1B_06780 [Streptomyces xiamenensis]|uniref:hypothetical protein n=1 Tax=Streptomyces xiamenensis TaxID=408015 RepID=UPI0035D9991B